MLTSYQKDQLDRWITGDYGEDQFRCGKCGRRMLYCDVEDKWFCICDGPEDEAEEDADEPE